jgi:hypothetical protein
MLTQAHRVLSEDQRSVTSGKHENLCEVQDGRSVRDPRRSHVDDVAVDQLDTCFRIEDAHLRHAVVVVHTEAVTTRQVGGGVRHGLTVRVHYHAGERGRYRRFACAPQPSP